MFCTLYGHCKTENLKISKNWLWSKEGTVFRETAICISVLKIRGCGKLCYFYFAVNTMTVLCTHVGWGECMYSVCRHMCVSVSLFKHVHYHCDCCSLVMVCRQGAGWPEHGGLWHHQHRPRAGPWTWQRQQLCQQLPVGGSVHLRCLPPFRTHRHSPGDTAAARQHQQPVAVPPIPLRQPPPLQPSPAAAQRHSTWPGDQAGLVFVMCAVNYQHQIWVALWRESWLSCESAVLPSL